MPDWNADRDEYGEFYLNPGFVFFWEFIGQEKPIAAYGGVVWLT